MYPQSVAGDTAFDKYETLIDEAVGAMRVDFRYSEAIAKAAGSLLSRRKAQTQKQAA